MTKEFNDFLQRYKIPEQRCFFPLEFMYEGAGAARVLYDLMDDAQKDEAVFRIREEYHKSLPQPVSHELRSAVAGSAEWFWARGVPNNLKSEFFRRMKEEDVQSSIGGLVGTLSSSLS